MTRLELRNLLQDVQAGRLTLEAAHDRLLQFLRQAPFEDFAFARVDHHRSLRQGFPEVIFGPGKTPQQIAAIAERIVAAGESLLVTRTDRPAFEAVAAVVPDANFHDLARTITRPAGEIGRGRGTIVIAAAGTADLPVAEEAAVSADLMGNDVDRMYDVGVAGLHRLLAEHHRLMTAPRASSSSPAWRARCRAWSAVSWTCRSLPCPRASATARASAGVTALLAMLNSCAAGVSVVNIDNGFGAAAIASSINHLP